MSIKKWTVEKAMKEEYSLGQKLLKIDMRLP